LAEQVYLNGEIVEAGAARVSAFDAGLTHAAGLFETMRAYRGRVFRPAAHVARLLRSAASLELDVSVTAEELLRAVSEVLAANALQEARLRLVVTPGDVPRPGREEASEKRPLVLATASPVQPHPPGDYQRGWRVCISPYKVNRYDPLAGHKTLAYLPRLLAMKDAANRGCRESLWFTTDHQLAEGSICNVFIVQEGVLRTPPVQTPILDGITRQTVIGLAKENGLAVEETAIDINMLLAAREVFLTGSVLEVMPVTSIEKHVVGEGEPGEVTRRVMEQYRSRVDRECAA
jgi:branched-chain amino acid aminotransferase